MSFDFDPIYLIWVLIGASAALTVEAVYLLCFSTLRIAIRSTGG